MLVLLALAALAAPSEIDQRVARLAVLYDTVCLKAFPDDKAVVALMIAQAASPMTPEQVKVTMVDDPARGWTLPDGNTTVWIEFPPYHACSVRWSAPTIGDLKPYRSLAAHYEQKDGDFHPASELDTDQGDIHIHATGEQRELADKSVESLFVLDQHITDAKRRSAGQTGVVLRFVHQFAAPAVRTKP